MRLGRHGNIVLCGQAKSCGTTGLGVAFHHYQFGDKPVHGQVVEQSFVNPETERPGIIQAWLEDVRVFGQHILPVGRPVISPSVISKQTVDHLGPAVLGRVLQKDCNLRLAGNHADCVQGDPPQELKVLSLVGGYNFSGFRIGGTFTNPLGDQFAFGL